MQLQKKMIVKLFRLQKLEFRYNAKTIEINVHIGQLWYGQKNLKLYTRSK